MAAVMPVRLDLGDGKVRLVKFGATAHSMFEKQCEFQSVDKMLEHGITWLLVQSMLYAGLLYSEPHLTFDGAGELMDGYMATGGTVDGLAVVLFTAYRDSRGIKRANGRDVDEARRPNGQAEAGQAASSPSGGAS